MSGLWFKFLTFPFKHYPLLETARLSWEAFIIVFTFY